MSRIETLLANSNPLEIELVVDPGRELGFGGWPAENTVSDVFTHLLRSGTRQRTLCTKVAFVCAISQNHAALRPALDISMLAHYMAGFEGRVVFEFEFQVLDAPLVRISRMKEAIVELSRALPPNASIVMRDLQNYARFQPSMTAFSQRLARGFGHMPDL